MNIFVLHCRNNTRVILPSQISVEIIQIQHENNIRYGNMSQMKPTVRQLEIHAKLLVGYTQNYLRLCNINTYITHIHTKPLALGPGVGLDPQRHNFVVSKNVEICFTPDAKPEICVSPNAKPQRKSVEYRWRWVFWCWGWRWACTFQVVCVNFICVW